MGGHWLAEQPQKKETSGLSSRGSEGADGKATRDRNAEQPGEDVNAGSVWAWGGGNLGEL